MKILIVSATEKEIYQVKKEIESSSYENITVDFLITGIGSVFTTYFLTRKLSEADYDLVINAGIAGSFNPELNIGEVVNVHLDQFADLGIEDKTEFQTLFEKGFISKDQFPFSNSVLINPYEFDLALKQVSAITVNTTHGSAQSVELFKNKFRVDIETMEGAAFFYVCLQEGVRFIQLRSISNVVEERNISNWNIPLAIKNLNQQLLEWINVIVEKGNK